MTRILALLLLSSPAFADAMVQDGGTGCRLVPVDGEAYVAEVRCRNILTSGEAPTEGNMRADGLTVHLTVVHRPGDIADEFTVTPPDGYLAVPDFMLLMEDETGVILLYQFVGM